MELKIIEESIRWELIIANGKDFFEIQFEKLRCNDL